MRKLLLVILVLVASIGQAIAQENIFRERYVSAKSPDIFIKNMNLNMAIDEDDFNMYIKHINSEKTEIILAGVASDLGGGLTSTSFNLVKGKLSFTIRLFYDNGTRQWKMQPVKLEYTFKDSYGSVSSIVSSEMLMEARDELVTMQLLDNKIEYDEYFYYSWQRKKDKIQELQSRASSTSIKKKELKRIVAECNTLTNQEKVYKCVHGDAELTLSKLFTHYFNK